MDMTIEEAIQWFEERENHWFFVNSMGAFRHALTALRAQQEAEKNEPLTYAEFSNEVRIHKDGWLWCVDLSGEGAHGWRKNENLNKYANITNYGKTWLAYRRPPVEEGKDHDRTA